MRTLLITILLSIISFNNTPAQIKKDTLVAYRYYQKADSLLIAKNYKESISLFEKAAPIYEKAKTWDRLANCYFKIGKNLQSSNDYKTALVFANKLLGVCDKHLSKNHLEKANYYDLMGKKAELSDLKYDVALEYYKKGLEIKQQHLQEISLPIALSNNYIGGIHEKQGDFEKALEQYKKSLSIKSAVYGKGSHKISPSIFDITDVYVQLGQFDNAIIIAENGLKIAKKMLVDNHPDIAKYHFEIAMGYKGKKKYKEALYHLEKSLATYKQNSENKKSAPTFVYGAMGTIYFELQKSEKAIEFYKMGLGDNATMKTKLTYFINYHNIAMVYSRIEELDLALQYLIPVVTRAQKVFGKNYFELTYAYQTLGIVYRKKKEFDKSLEYHDLSLKILQKKFGQNHPRIVDAYVYLGDLYTDKKKYDKAIDYYNKSLQVSINLYKSNYLGISNAYNLLAKNYFLKGAYELALKNLNLAKKNSFFEGYEQKNNLNEDYENCFNPRSLLDIYLNKAKTYKEQFISNKEHNPTLVLKTFKNVNSLISLISRDTNNLEDKIIFSKKITEAYTEAIDFQYYLFSQNGNKQHIKNAYDLAEKSKSITLKSLLNDANAKSFAGLENSILELDRNLKTDRAYYTSERIAVRNTKKRDTTTILSIESKLFEITRKQDSLTKILEKNYPKYHQIKYKNKVIAIEEIQKNIEDHVTLLEFFVTDSVTYTFTISKDKYDVKKLSTPQLEKQITAFRTAITKKDIKSYKKSARELYTILIEPIKERLIGEELIIVPDESLWHLNFELLLTKDSPSQAPANLPYLLRDYAISYANSATLLFSPFKNEKQAAKQEGCLAFSFSDTTHSMATTAMSLATLRNTEEDLPGTRAEIKAISEIVDGQYFFGANANESTFKQHASDYKILHLALHGEVDNEQPENSKLYFTKGKDSIEDNYLYSHELFALHIPAELTVLSACNTGTGKITKGEGIMSLGNAFQYAGTKSLLLSSWDISDATTPRLMKNFYSNLKEGMNKARALQKAKLQYLQRADAYKTAPFYWGAFYLVGNTAPININNSTNWYLILGISIFLFILFLTWMLYQKKQQKNNSPSSKKTRY